MVKRKQDEYQSYEIGHTKNIEQKRKDIRNKKFSKYPRSGELCIPWHNNNTITETQRL